MKRTTQFFVIIGILMTFPAVVVSQQREIPTQARSSDNSISGDWEVTLSIQGQTSKINFRIKLDGERAVIENIALDGTITAHIGTWIGNKLSFSQESPNAVATMTGTLQGEKLIGDINVAVKNGPQITGKWEANRTANRSQSLASSETAKKDETKETLRPQSQQAAPEDRELFYLLQDLDDAGGRALEAATRAGNLGLKAKAAIPKLEMLKRFNEGGTVMVEFGEDVRREATIALQRIQTRAIGKKVTSNGKTVELAAVERDTGQSNRYVPNKSEHLWIRVSFKTDDPNLTAEKIEANDSLCGSIRSGQGIAFSPSGGGLLGGNPVCVFAVWKKALNLALELPGYPPLPLGF
ncbi:MAG: hypothetical protein ACT4OT_18715 [Acidobacteriota bacterium]